MNQGLLAAIGAFLIWGLFPLYWKVIDHVPSLEVMAHRLVWCFVAVAIYLAVRRPHWWKAIATQPRLLRLLTISAVLISMNWWLYIWAVNNGHIVETSLGYFINPLVNVLLGVVVLGERLNPRQWIAVVIAAAGVLYLTLQVGRLPWIAIGLAASFATYGLIRKVAVVESIPALGYESSVLFLPCLGYLAWLQVAGESALLNVDATTDAFLVGAGLVTALPLVLFAYGAQRIPYSLVGIVQYLAPSLQLMCGVMVFNEPFSRVQMIGFSCIWVALAIYAGDGLWRMGLRRG